MGILLYVCTCAASKHSDQSVHLCSLFGGFLGISLNSQEAKALSKNTGRTLIRLQVCADRP